MLAGVAFPVLFVVGLILDFGDTPNVKSSDTAATASQKWVNEISGSGHRAGLIISAYLLVLAAIALVWFCSGLREWLGASQAAGRVISSLAVLGAATIAVASMTGGAAAAGGITFGNEPKPLNGDAIRAIAELFYPLLFVVFGLISGALIATITASAARSGKAPRWIVYAGWVAALAALAGVAFFPFLLTMVWWLALGIVCFVRSGAGAPVQAE
jgi:hypothetical protein